MLNMAIRRALTPEECSKLIHSADAYAAQHGWTKGRHRQHATVDVPIGFLDQHAQMLWQEQLSPRISAIMAQDFPFEPHEIIPRFCFFSTSQYGAPRAQL